MDRDDPAFDPGFIKIVSPASITSDIKTREKVPITDWLVNHFEQLGFSFLISHFFK